MRRDAGARIDVGAGSAARIDDELEVGADDKTAHGTDLDAGSAAEGQLDTEGNPGIGIVIDPGETADAQAHSENRGRGRNGDGEFVAGEGDAEGPTKGQAQNGK